MRLVLDTNIYLAAMGHRSFCFDLFIKLLEDRQYEIFISPDILRELKKKTGILIGEKLIANNYAKRMLFLVSYRAINVQPEEKIKTSLRDPKDRHILECSAECRAHIILTMDQDLIKLKRFRTAGIIHPKTFPYILPLSK